MLTRNEILEYLTGADDNVLFARAMAVRREAYGNDVYVRGLIEFSNRCANDCTYCGLRRSNRGQQRYRMSTDAILETAGRIHEAGITTVVMQSGDDAGCSCGMLCDVITGIKARYPGMAVTLSVGERHYADYRAFAAAGADRFLLRHEAADPALYRLHHPGKRFGERRRILEFLKECGLQAGGGFMVGLPFQTQAHIAADILFLQEFQPEMIGIGPFLPHHATPLHGHPAGNYRLTLRALALARIAVPGALMPATTALSTLNPENGLVGGFKSGCNVVMIDFTPERSRQLYTLYDNKAAVSLQHLKTCTKRGGMRISTVRGDCVHREGVKR